MKSKLLLIFAMALLVTPAGAQDWQSDSSGNVEYNCETIMDIIDEFGIVYYLILGTDDLTPGDGDAEHYVHTDVSLATVAESLLIQATGCGTALVAVDNVVDIYEPDKWKLNVTREYFYQCDVVRAIVAAYGDLDFRRDGDRHDTVLSYFHEDARECVPRYVVTKVHSEVFACPASDCDKINRVMRWQAWRVVGLSEGWYEIVLEDETGFIAASDVMPGPYALFQVDQHHVSQYHDCIIFVDRKPEDFRFVAILKAGPAYQEIEVSIYKPAIDIPLEIADESHGEFNDSGEPYILQVSSLADYFPAGAYMIELAWNGRIFLYGLDVQETALFMIHFYCD